VTRSVRTTQFRAATGATAVLHELGAATAAEDDADAADAAGPGTAWDEPVMQYLYRLTVLDRAVGRAGQGGGSYILYASCVLRPSLARRNCLGRTRACTPSDAVPVPPLLHRAGQADGSRSRGGR
jgi:hypothetical protein